MGGAARGARISAVLRCCFTTSWILFIKISKNLQCKGVIEILCLPGAGNNIQVW